jgi:hypothetical protein
VLSLVELLNLGKSRHPDVTKTDNREANTIVILHTSTSETARILSAYDSLCGSLVPLHQNLEKRQSTKHRGKVRDPLSIRELIVHKIQVCSA